MAFEATLDRYDIFVSSNSSYTKVFTKKKSSEEEERTKNINNRFKKNKKWVIHKYDDIVYSTETGTENLYIQSKLRGITIVVKNILFEVIHNIDKATLRVDKLFAFINKADESYELKNSNDANPESYIHFLYDAYTNDCDENDAVTFLKNKQELKRKTKANNRFRYKIGDYYALNVLNVNKENTLVGLYKVVKFIYTISDTPVSIVIMKLELGNCSQRQTLSYNDCKSFHIKYEPDLYVFPMSTRFQKLTKKDVKEILENEFRNTSKSISNNIIGVGGCVVSKVIPVIFPETDPAQEKKYFK